MYSSPPPQISRILPPTFSPAKFEKRDHLIRESRVKAILQLMGGPQQNTIQLTCGIQRTADQLQDFRRTRLDRALERGDMTFKAY